MTGQEEAGDLHLTLGAELGRKHLGSHLLPSSGVIEFDHGNFKFNNY